MLQDMYTQKVIYGLILPYLMVPTVQVSPGTSYSVDAYLVNPSGDVGYFDLSGVSSSYGKLFKYL